MQSYTEIKPTDYLKDSREVINNNFITLMSDFSGTVFPTNDLVAGMKCNRTDQKKVYILQQDLATWTELFDYSNNKITVPNAQNAQNASNAQTAQSATYAERDATGNNIINTYLPKNSAVIDVAAQPDGSIKVTKGNGSTNTITIPQPEIATQTEAETGEDNTKFMTPLRVKQAIAVSENKVTAIEKGGTGATTPALALENLGITHGTDDLTTGETALTTGAIYIVYE